MFKPLQFDAATEARVRFVEETDPANMVPATLALLRSGTTPRQMLTASSLAVVRSTELPAQHHGGPVHPISGVHACDAISRRLGGELGLLPILQHAVVCNHHVHTPSMGPYLMPVIEPMQGSARSVSSFHISEAEMNEGYEARKREAETVAGTRAALHRSLRALEGPAAERYFLWLLERLPHDEVIDLLLPLAIRRNHWDDHNFVYPVFTARALDAIGWEWGSVLFRPAVRYQARRMNRLTVGKPLDYKWVESLLDEYKLLELDIPEHSSASETDRIGELGRRLGRVKHYFDTIEPMAQALATGMSLEGVGEALSIGAATAYLSSSYGNPLDAHMHTGTNNRRYLLRQAGVSKRNKIMALLVAFTGPEVVLAERLVNWSDNVEADTTSRLPARSQERLLDAIVESVEATPWLDWRKIGVDRVVAPDHVRDTIALARQYAEKGYDADVYFRRMGEIACRDDFTEMHAVKHFQAIVDEYYTTRPPFRWVHLVSAAKSAAVIHLGREQSVYKQARPLLAA